jgi:hypothetical protein
MVLVEWTRGKMRLILSLATGRLGGVEDRVVGSANTRLREEGEGRQRKSVREHK